ncbi:phosphoserine aminotransferase [Candidatus Hydrogenosomobacter endosymbioticus]|uniref:Phosphoserine aminotransferase n=1 Tax=Candidatus Hydrogenosomobacter endosymbioticus TaxID=2558174 RepID=A0ABM7V9M8_9PROT|nr:phosphoserine aminotransferase [Candidatus Hydrogenosomobacter endosymbioticus]
MIGISHRSPIGVSRVADLIGKLREILEIPQSHKIAILPASSTGAIETAIWNLLGKPRVGIDSISWDLFSKTWELDVREQLKIQDVTPFCVKDIENLHNRDHSRDILFSLTGTTSGLSLNKESLKFLEKRKGISVCDAASAVMTSEIDWSLLDATGFSLQKGFGAEAGTGVLVLSTMALKRLSEYTPSWPIPKIFRLKSYDGSIIDGIFRGEMINTQSLLCIEEAIDAVTYAQNSGGLKHALSQIEQNFKELESWVKAKEWVMFLVEDERYRAKSCVCLKITDSYFNTLTTEKQWLFLNEMQLGLSHINAAHNIVNHPLCGTPSLRIWCGPTVETEDISSLLPWIELAFTAMKGLCSEKL